jgi:hypothetical protein
MTNDMIRPRCRFQITPLTICECAPLTLFPNQSASASLALDTASSSVSPAVAQPGSSGKAADHRLVVGSYSRRSRKFMLEKYQLKGTPDNRLVRSARRPQLGASPGFCPLRRKVRKWSFGKCKLLYIPNSESIKRAEFLRLWLVHRQGA